MRYGNIIKSYEIPFKQWSPARQAQWKNGMLKNLLEINRGLVATSYGFEYNQVIPVIFGALSKSDKQFPIPLDGTLSPTDSQGLEQGKDYACLLWEYFVGVNLLETPKILEPPANALNNNNTEPVVKEPEKEVLPELMGQQNTSQDDDEQEEKETIKEVTKLTDEIDKEDDKKSSSEEDNDKDFSKISDSLQNIKGSISSQASIVTAISNTNAGSIQTLGLIKDIFTTQNELIKKQFEDEEKRQNESAIEQSTKNSGSVKSTSTMDTGNASGEIIKIDGDVLTVKPTEGSFQKGQQISSGGGGFDLFGMLKGIAGKFGKGKGGGGGGGSPIKMSMGGFLNTSYPAMAKGGISPGIYDKPTRGNLMPGQAVIPLNRNVGKNLDPRKKVLNKSQPFADAMQTPVKAIGAAIIATAGNFIRALGPLGGFFAPYITSLITPMGLVLGLSTSVIEGILGGPAYAATLDQKKQVDVFSKLWSDLMKLFGFNFGGEDDKDNKNKTQQTKGKVIQGGNADFWSLAAVASLEGATPQGEADVAQAVYNRVASGVYGVKTIKDAILSPGQFQPVTYDGADLDKWKAISDRESAIAAVATHKGKGIETATKYVDEGAANITNPQLKQSASEFVGGRTDFAVPSAANKYPGGFGYVERDGHLFGWYVGPGAIAYGKTNPGPASMPNFNISAESGINAAQGKPMDAFTLTGPASGYEVPGVGTMHGKEALIRYDQGFTVLPIENKKFSMQKDPLKTINRWGEILNGSPTKKPGYEIGGRGLSTRGVQAGFTGMNKQGFDAIMGGDKFRLGKFKPQILGRGAYSAPTMKGAQRYAGTSGSLGGRQTAGGVVKSIVPGGARRINFLEPQAAVAPGTFDKGKMLADKLLSGAYSNSPLANKLRGQLISGVAKTGSGLIKLFGKAIGVLNAPLIGDMLFPEAAGNYDQLSGPNANPYYNANTKPTSFAPSGKNMSRASGPANNKVSTTIVPSKQKSPNVQVVPQGQSNQPPIVHRGNTKPVGTMLNNLSVPNYG